jgi:hypothetical protein
MDVNEHERLSNITLNYECQGPMKLKRANLRKDWKMVA